MVLRSVERSRAPGEARELSIGRPFEGEAAIGPFAQRALVWEGESESVLVGRDERLDRDVWIHRYRDPSAARSPQQEFQVRSTRLPWP